MGDESGLRVEEIKDAFRTLGALRNRDAWVLAAIWSMGTCTVQQICQATGLQQPEVSMGVRSLKQFIRVDQQRGSAGRPLNSYSILSPQAVIEFVRGEERRRSAAAQRRLAILEAQANGLGGNAVAVANTS